MQRIDALLDVRIRDRAIVEIGEHLIAEPNEDVLDAANACVAPGFIDMHVHLREPGNPEKETLATGLAAAAAGGFTAVAAMPNTVPALDAPELVRWLKQSAARAGAVRVYPVAAITRAREGREPVEYGALQDAGAVAFSDDGSTIESAIVQTGAALRARETGLAFLTHCEDAAIKMLDEFDPRAEHAAVARDVAIAAATGMRWHIAHVSTRGALWAIEAGKRSNPALTCEVTPHHLVFTLEEAFGRGGVTKVNPPLRTADDVAALRNAVRDGTIDAFGSDHAPHADDGSPGFSGLEIAAGAYALAVPELPLTRYVELLSSNPARILNVSGGSLAVGSPADVTIFADREWIVDPSTFCSKGKRTPFAGMKLPRRAIATIVNGVLAMRNGELLAGAPR